MSINDDASDLRYLLAGYFHQDWDLDAPDAAAVIDLFGREDTLERVAAARDCAAELAASNVIEDELAMTLKAAGSEYYPPGDGMTYRDFIDLVERRLSLAIQDRDTRLE